MLNLKKDGPFCKRDSIRLGCTESVVVGYFVLNGRLRQHFSLHQAFSHIKGDKRKK